MSGAYAPPAVNPTLPVSEKIHLIERHFREIMLALGLDIMDDSLKNTPLRVARMYVNEIFSGLDPLNEPSVTLFENKYRYEEIILEKDIPLYSYCEHHFVPIIGKAHVAYIAGAKIAGLSKLNRVVRYFSKRPQVQERLTLQIAGFLKEKLETDDVAVIIEAEHLCVASRGVKDMGSTTLTASYHGLFEEQEKKNELLHMVHGSGIR
ncbi:MAG: GTP cyclohydrolase I FolE [Bacteroidota bacterium]|nr:GTP cyclohydrolase I FolE [Bacteroidota bacterium]MDP4214761.1 GTP cyclohydrolase I FolE [Bacteroidota bacterium]MDP4245671.1 GTP cyclohydrolase I FolE [Bacteroidota bacterium]MDP4253425.1 GTP cyclohydrolase I FolE [Bacteroidota bacterium]MDP4256860.1 GTP cyclohydrolase I FolE [Bacteroidota bacterium]